MVKPYKSLCLNAYSEDPSIKLESKVDIYNEMRAAGSSLALGGVVILLGIFFPQIRLASFLVSVVIFIGHALGRLVSSKLEGKPNKQLGQGLMSELILGCANLICLAVMLLS